MLKAYFCLRSYAPTVRWRVFRLREYRWLAPRMRPEIVMIFNAVRAHEALPRSRSRALGGVGKLWTAWGRSRRAEERSR